MPLATNPEWQQLALYALGAALLLFLLFRIPYIGRALRLLFSLAITAFCIFVLLQQGPYDPNLARLMAKMGLDDQQVSGEEVSIRMSADGHFWARAAVNGVERRMLVDSGATVTALSERTARLASVDRRTNVLPVVMRTANGAVRADPASVERLRLGSIEARNLKVVISPALGDVDILGMNFLSQLASWRVEGRTLILVPRGSNARGTPTAD
jgi:aspartyl protease family protein